VSLPFLTFYEWLTRSEAPPREAKASKQGRVQDVICVANPSITTSLAEDEGIVGNFQRPTLCIASDSAEIRLEFWKPWSLVPDLKVRAVLVGMMYCWRLYKIYEAHLSGLAALQSCLQAAAYDVMSRPALSAYSMFG
jgi:hypothetical protein